MPKQWLYSCCVLTGIIITLVCLAGVTVQQSATAGETTPVPPFIDDPAVIGTWYSVDYVSSINQFTPGQRTWKNDLFLSDITFSPGGIGSGAWRWSKGCLWWDSGDKHLCKYEIREIDGETYLFLEWVNGDVIDRGAKPSYYVLVRGAAKNTDTSSLGLVRACGVINIGVGLLFIAISIPLVLRMIPMNGLYGFRIPKAFISAELWYDINAYGGKQMILWSIIMIAVSIVGIFLVNAQASLMTLLAVSVGPAVISPTIAVIVTLIHAARLQPPEK
ncbi:MAG TPA: SdpI family protein [Candidatus Hydrogenedentes bacterium]|nr:SdpI family protein [Candidatus Hydrogenedentota bacterium]